MNIDDEGGHVSMLDHLYEHTKQEKSIMELCQLAAEKMLMTSDAEYGQIMMFSYDCFARFHSVLQWYFAGLVGDWDTLGVEEGVMEQRAMEHLEWLRGYFMGEGNSDSNSKT